MVLCRSKKRKEKREQRLITDNEKDCFEKINQENQDDQWLNKMDTETLNVSN